MSDVPNIPTRYAEAEIFRERMVAFLRSLSALHDATNTDDEAQAAELALVAQLKLGKDLASMAEEAAKRGWSLGLFVEHEALQVKGVAGPTGTVAVVTDG